MIRLETTILKTILFIINNNISLIYIYFNILYIYIIIFND